MCCYHLVTRALAANGCMLGHMVYHTFHFMQKETTAPKYCAKNAQEYKEAIQISINVLLCSIFSTP